MTTGTIDLVRLVVQRVASAGVSVEGVSVASIGPGYLVLAGSEVGDSKADVSAAVDKLVGLRLFADEVGKMNLDIGSVGGEMLVVSQFTLLGDARKGRRPSFTRAAPPEEAKRLIEELVESLRAVGINTKQGVFGAHMRVQLVNDGPVTMMLDFKEGRLV